MNKKLLAIGIGLVAVLLGWSGVSIYPEWIWFENLGFSPVFWTMLLSKFGFGFVIWLFLILIISLNLYVAKRLHPGGGPGLGFKAADDYVAQFGLSGRALNSLLIAVILIASFYIASKGADQWNLLLRYLNQQPFGSTDPIFNRDIGFYLFSLPIYLFVRDGLVVL
ncbi:MAG: UPF0182 family protein, partial [Desulfobulbia bacterium]